MTQGNLTIHDTTSLSRVLVPRTSSQFVVWVSQVAHVQIFIPQFFQIFPILLDPLSIFLFFFIPFFYLSSLVFFSFLFHLLQEWILIVPREWIFLPPLSRQTINFGNISDIWNVIIIINGSRERISSPDITTRSPVMYSKTLSEQQSSGCDHHYQYLITLSRWSHIISIRWTSCKDLSCSWVTLTLIPLFIGV